MFIDVRSIEDGSDLACGICIVGAGAAGITLARELAAARRDVILLESGGIEPEAATQALYAGTVDSPILPPLDADRLRWLGGTTNHWSGSCRPFDEQDFRPRPGIERSGWPFEGETLTPYYRRAQNVLQLGPFDYEPTRWTPDGAAPLDFGAGARIVNGVFQTSPPTRFGEVYGDELKAAPTLRVVLHANAVEIETDETAREVTGIAVATLDGRRFRVTARRYVLAAGAIETARLLLASDRVERAGLGNGRDLVGRCFSDHPYTPKAATILFGEMHKSFPFYADYPVVRGIKVTGYLALTAACQEAERLPNASFTLDHGQLADASDGGASLRVLYKSARAGRWPEDLGAHLGRILGDLDGLAGAAFERLRRGTPQLFSVAASFELPPDPANRVTLDRGTDALGMRRARVTWKLPGEFDRWMRRSLQILGEELGRAGLGRLRIGRDWIVENGHHHMGTARMHREPGSGVVDADCRVHGKANLYVAGAAVFPTISHDNPTMTLVALALRLADHLKAAEG